MELAVQHTSAVVRVREMAAAPAAEAEALRSARMGTLAPQLQVAPSVQVDPVQPDRRDRPDTDRDKVVPLRPVAPLSNEPASGAPTSRYRYKVAHAPDLDRPLLQIVDEKTNQILVSLPPEQLVRMLEDAKALVDDRLKEPQGRRLDTTV